MHSIKSFIRKFTADDIPHIHKFGRKYFLVEPELLAFQQQIPEQPEYLGLFLGEERKEFASSLALLDIIARHSEKKVFINDEAEWLFLCGRDVFGINITKSNSDLGLVLVQNKRDENLGMAKLEKTAKGLFLKNLLDKGEYLRSEDSPGAPKHSAAKKRKPR